MPELSAPAKINLVLDVLGKREDGYHELRTVLQTLALADRVSISRGKGRRVTVSGPYAAGTPADERNLAWRAAAALAERCGRDVDGLCIAIEKHIPAAAGLGGGASDAASTLRLLQRWWPEATDATLREAANAVGSDETFFLAGGTAMAEGRGERVTPLEPLDPHDIVLFVPRETLDAKTATLFRALAGTPYDNGDASAAFVRRHPRALTTEDLHNAFERVAYEVFPGLGKLRQEIEGRIGAPVRLAGAGPTMFWIGQPGSGAAIAESGRGLTCDVFETRTAGAPWAR